MISQALSTIFSRPRSLNFSTFVLAVTILQIAGINCCAWAGEIMKSDGLNVIHETNAVALRSQVGRIDSQLKEDALLNAQEVLARYPKITVIHVIFGTTQNQHVYKRVDVDAAQITKIAKAPESLQVVPWDALIDKQLPGYKEMPKSKAIFADDTEHCRHGSMWINGEFTNADSGTVLLAKTAEELKQLKERSASPHATTKQSGSLPTGKPSSAKVRSGNPFDELSQLRSAQSSPSTNASSRLRSGQSYARDPWQSLKSDYPAAYKAAHQK